MNYLDKISYLTLAFMLLLDYRRKFPLAEAMRLAPFTAHARQLTRQLIAERTASSGGTAVAQGSEGSAREAGPCNEVNQLKPAGEPPMTPIGSPNSLDEGTSGVVSETKLHRAELWCPGCGSHKYLTLEHNQLEHLEIRGHLEMHCGYCEAPSLWGFVKEVEEPVEVLL